MLDKDTKQKINNARQILVGAVPSPEAQVQQITIAMLYKFMDDMDESNKLAGLKAQFFKDDLKDFRWKNLVDPRQEPEKKAQLYMNALDSFSKSKHLPEIFQTIFKGVFIPYRNAELLSLFIKEIDKFSYDNSENLGSAFEYLLQIMGAQGDAGQFRTPRNIIDFIVEIVAPTKDDKILDPACGTGGFLISSYKYIKKINSKNYNSKEDVPTFAQKDIEDINDAQIQSNGKYKGDLLLPQDKMKISKNIIGYDIAPEMVRLATVNLYLHDFKSAESNIIEYDTLTKENQWDKEFNVILANPPFMTPRGGINPHSKFNINASRSEVLFVNYIAKHLKRKGRAGIIVPEGIIFKGDRSYKELRKYLVEEWGLWAVVSLPAGIFQPYSGVKTSILFLDRTRADNKEIVFVKVDNDGFNLGATRRHISENDLPKAFKIIREWKDNRKKIDSSVGIFINKEEIAKDEEYNLSLSRYAKDIEDKEYRYPLVKVGDVCDLQRGSMITKNMTEEGDVPVIASSKKPSYYHNKSNRKPPTITISSSGDAGFVNFFRIPIFASDCFTVDPKDKHQLDINFLYYILKSKQEDIYKFQKGVAQKHVYPKDVSQIKISLPPIETQKEIVAEIQNKQEIVDNAKKIIKNAERERERILEMKLRKLKM